MRPTVRPFKIEFKTRSSRSTPMRPPTNDAGKDRATPSFLDANVFTAGRNNHANDYEAARKAAEAVFGRSVPAAPRPETNPPLNAPVGRVLPSLIENSVAPTIDWWKPMKSPSAVARQVGPRPSLAFNARSRPFSRNPP